MMYEASSIDNHAFMVIERTQSGKAIAKQNPDFREGRPKKFKPQQIKHALELLDSGMSYKQVEVMTGISKSTLIRNRRKQLLTTHGFNQ